MSTEREVSIPQGWWGAPLRLAEQDSELTGDQAEAEIERLLARAQGTTPRNSL